MDQISRILELLERKSLPIPSIAKIELILLLCGDTFVHKLESDLDNDESSHQYVWLVLKSASPFCEQILRENNLPFSFTKILQVALCEGRLFFKSIKALSDDRNKDFALEYLRSRFSEYDGRRLTLTTGIDSREKDEKKYSSHHAYGRSFALCFGLGYSSTGSPVVNIDGAPATGNRSYDWKRKVAIQLSIEEIFKLLAALQGKLDSVKFSNHGQDKKYFELYVQTEKGVYLAKIGSLHSPCMNVQISAATGVSISMLLIQHIFEYAPHMNRSSLAELLDTMANLMTSSA